MSERIKKGKSEGIIDFAARLIPPTTAAPTGAEYPINTITARMENKVKIHLFARSKIGARELLLVFVFVIFLSAPHTFN